MKYLLDVDVLVAPCVREHEFHERVASWMNESARAGRSELITCAVTELGFVRTLARAEPYGFTIEQGKDLLSQLKSSKEFHFVFLSDGLGLAQLPRLGQRGQADHGWPFAGAGKGTRSQNGNFG